MNTIREKYGEMINNIEIRDILLKKMSLEDVIFPQNKFDGYNVKLDYNCKNYKKNDDSIEFYPEFKVNIECENNDIFNLEFELRAIYILENVKKYDDELINKFIEINLPINVWPYAREIISSITTRVGYQPLIIPPYKG